MKNLEIKVTDLQNKLETYLPLLENLGSLHNI